MNISNCHYYSWVNEVKSLNEINKILDKKSVFFDNDIKKAKQLNSTFN